MWRMEVVPSIQRSLRRSSLLIDPDRCFEVREGKNSRRTKPILVLPRRKIPLSVGVSKTWRKEEGISEQNKIFRSLPTSTNRRDFSDTNKQATTSSQTTTLFV